MQRRKENKLRHGSVVLQDCGSSNPRFMSVKLGVFLCNRHGSGRVLHGMRTLLLLPKVLRHPSQRWRARDPSEGVEPRLVPHCRSRLARVRSVLLRVQRSRRYISPWQERWQSERTAHLRGVCRAHRQAFAARDRHRGVIIQRCTEESTALRSVSRPYARKHARTHARA